MELEGEVQTTFLATLALSNVDKPDQHIIEQDTTLFLALNFPKLWENLKA